MPVILKLTTSIPHFVTGANGTAVTFSENEADALLFVDGAAATTFSTGKNIHGAVQVTVTGSKNYGKKTANQ